MTTIVSASTDDTIVGLSGRTLKISSYMKNKNSNNEYRLGLKSLYDLYPSRIREKIAADAKQKHWDEKNKKVLADISRDIADFDGKNSSTKFSLSFLFTFVFVHIQYMCINLTCC
jgi:tripeptidyl-peptidase-2